MDTIYLNPGPLTSFNSLTYNFGPQLERLRNLYVHGSSPNIILDLKHLEGHVNISALAALLSTCRKLSLFIGKPIETEFTLNQFVQSFLNHVGFFHIAKHRRILAWDERTVGGFWPSNINPNTKILEFGDVFESIEKYSAGEIINIKAQLKQRIGPNFSLRCSNIFKGLYPKLEYAVENTTLELITNCLIHAKDFAFVGLQRTSNKIIVSVSDSGIGFKRSLINSYPEIEIFKKASNIQSLILGSLIQEKEHGLRLAISNVLNYDENIIDDGNYGWVNVSSYNSEIRWQKKNWERALLFYKQHDVRTTLPDVSYILGEEINKKLSEEELEEGYRKTFNIPLIGSRVSFSILA